MANMVVRTNIFALNAHRNMKNVGLEQQRASNRLASGFRINSAADDAAGLAISESMRAQIRGLDQASRNAQDGQALINTAEGGMQEIQNMMQRIRELTVQAANDTNTPDNRGQIALEVGQLLEEIDAMAGRVEFNGMTLLNDTVGTASAGRANLGTAVMGLASAIGGGSLTATFTAFSQANIDALWLHVGGSPAVAAGEARSTHLAAHLGIAATLLHLVSGTNVTAAQFAALSDTVNILARAAAGGLYYQVGANSNQLMRTVIDDMRLTDDTGAVTALGLGGAMHPFIGGWRNDFLTGTATQISARIDQLDAGLLFVSNARANLGAYSNRLDFTSRSLDISSENLSDAESRVRNTDMAREMMRFTMSNVLQQAAVSMLAQANQLPNNLLQLLR